MKIILCILDGIGWRKEIHGNAVKLAHTPNLDKLVAGYPHALLEASGEQVGLPRGQAGNCEVGHQNIGAGRIVYQPLQLINQKIQDKTFFQNDRLLNVINYVKTNESRLHLLGLVSDGGIQSHINHLFALLDMVKDNGIEKLYLHVFLDGRDTLPQTASIYLDQLQTKLDDLGIGQIATICGRDYAMDHNKQWARVKLAYEAIVSGVGESFPTYQKVIEANYQRGFSDEFVVPAIIEPQGIIQDQDGLIAFNFEPEQIRQLLASITNEQFESFDRTIRKNIKLVTMLEGSPDVLSQKAFHLEPLYNTLGDYLSTKGIKQLRIAETARYPHVTYFFDGRTNKNLAGVEQIELSSSNGVTDDQLPEMSAIELTDEIIKKAEQFDFIVANYASGDIVGHTGNLQATIKAIETIDQCLGRLYETLSKLGYKMIITADHGNSDYMLDHDNQMITSHSPAPVPFLITDKNLTIRNGKLGDIAPTILRIMNREIPKEMTGEVLISKKID